LQHLHRVASDEERLRRDVEHVLAVISENRKALNSVTVVLGSLHEEVRSLDASLQPSLQLLRRVNSRHTAGGAASGGTGATVASTAEGGRTSAGQPSTTSAAPTTGATLAAPAAGATLTRSRKKSVNDYAPRMLDNGGGENGSGGPTLSGNSVRKNSKASLGR
jgi:hypothetical protein